MRCWIIAARAVSHTGGSVPIASLQRFGCIYPLFHPVISIITTETYIPKVRNPSDLFHLIDPHLVSSYVRELENRLAQLERLVREVYYDTILFLCGSRLNSKPDI